MSLLHDLYLYGKRKGYDKHGVLLQRVPIHWYIDLKTNGSFDLVQAEDGTEHLLKTYGTRTSRRTLDNPRVNTLWDEFNWYSSKSPDGYEDIFWDRASEVLSGAGEEQLVRIIGKARDSVFISALQNELEGNFALRYNKELIFHKENVLSFLDTETETGDKSVCLLTGDECVPVRLHPDVPIPGFLYTSSPTISFNADVFNTGKLKQGGNFPISRRATNSYSLAFTELAKTAIRLKGRLKDGSGNRVAVIIWSDEDSPNIENIRSILGGKEPDWNLSNPSGNVHFLAIGVEEKRRPIIAYDVQPESVVLQNLRELRAGSFGLFEEKSIRDQLTSIELSIHREQAGRRTVGRRATAPRARVGREFPPEIVVSLFRHSLFGVQLPRILKQNMIRLFNKRTQKDGLRLGWENHLYVKWIEFFLFSEKRYV